MVVDFGVTRLDYFLKVSATNFQAEIAQIFTNFLGHFEVVHL